MTIMMSFDALERSGRLRAPTRPSASVCAGSSGNAKFRRFFPSAQIPLKIALGLCLILCSLSPGKRALAEPIAIGYVGQQPEESSRGAITDEGIAGARLGISDNETTGPFVGLSFVLNERGLPSEAAAIQQLTTDSGARFIVTNLPAGALHELAGRPAAKGITFVNISAKDDRLRQADCMPNVLHTAPSLAMLADALSQYLVWKQWTRWFLVIGPTQKDRLHAAALRKAAEKFGARIVVEKEWSFRTANARADTGHVTLQTEIPAFTRVADHDVLVVTDETEEFGEYLFGRTALPRPVAGTHGLVPTSWDVTNEQWGATQLQHRFRKRFGRAMTAIDYGAWLAVRAIGEAAVRSKSADPTTIASYLRGPDFALSGYKGRGQSFREWDGQMRQPILLTGPKLLVSVSPQPGFLHRTSELDTLGVDQSESRCRK
jgi:ABC transporter substrate binding protein (PQQ-dependent alcohol dehydrogenase system)